MNSKSGVNERLKDAREYLGLTIDSVSNVLQVSPEYLVEIENGQKVASKDQLQKFSNLYKHPVNYFLNGEYEHDTKVQLLARTVSNLSETDREHVLRFSNVLSKMR